MDVKPRINIGWIFLLLAMMAASTSFFLAIVATPPAMAVDPQHRVIYCEGGGEINSENTQTNLTVDLANKEVIGKTVTAYAVLTDGNGSPIVAAPIHFYVSGGNTPSIWVGHAITDCEGVAILRFTRNGDGPLEITAKFDGGNGFSPNEITATLELKRLAQPEPEIARIGSIGVTLLLGLIVAVAVLGAVLAAREDRREEAARLEQRCFST